MTTTTVKVQESTKEALDEFKGERESYDDAIRKLIVKTKQKELRKELIEGYTSAGKKDLKLLEHWEVSSEWS